MPVSGNLDRPLWGDFSPTRTDQRRGTTPAKRRTGSGQFRPFDSAKKIVDNLQHINHLHPQEEFMKLRAGFKKT